MYGWEPREVVEYEYDDQGRLTRALVTREAEFSEDDIIELLGLKALLHDTGRYGESLAEAFSDEASPEYYGDGAIRYVAKWRINQAEAAIDRARDADKDLPHGASWYVERKTY